MAKFRASYRGIGKMLKSEGMQAEMRRRAENVKSAAEALSPHETGEYAASFEVESGVRRQPTTRAYGRVRNTSDHALIVEVGAKATPAYHVLENALEAAKD